MYDKVVVVTRKTRLDGLIERFNTKEQARFYIEHAGLDFSDYVNEHERYDTALRMIRTATAFRDRQQQLIDRELLPTYQFGPHDLIVTLGGNGLVANTAKYVGRRPIVPINPDTERFDAILVPYKIDEAQSAIERALADASPMREVTLAQADLSDGQRLLAFNDLFIGARTHVSARYRLSWHDTTEAQSSSGVIVSTGAGSSGWMSSVFNMTAGVSTFTGGSPGKTLRLPWDDPNLIFAVREPFTSQRWKAGIVAGLLDPGESLRLESMMPNEGVIFSDGVESDYLEFGAGLVATIHAAPERARLVWR